MRAHDVPESLANRPAPAYELTTPVGGKPLPERRLAIISTAGLMHRGEQPFSMTSNDYRIIDTESKADILMSHISTNFDRTGFIQDHNLLFPIDRLIEKVERKEIGSVARFHYSFMGALSPTGMEAAANQLADTLKGDAVDGLILVPV